MNENLAKKTVILNLAFWITAITFPYVLRLLPSSTGAPPKFYEFFVPVFQFMLAGGATWMVKSALDSSRQS
jgi:hypothetical protein